MALADQWLARSAVPHGRVREPIRSGFVTTVAVTFWYAWLFNHASGSSLLTLIAHGAEGGVRITGFWAAVPTWNA